MYSIDFCKHLSPHCCTYFICSLHGARVCGHHILTLTIHMVPIMTCSFWISHCTSIHSNLWLLYFIMLLQRTISTYEFKKTQCSSHTSTCFSSYWLTFLIFDVIFCYVHKDMTLIGNTTMWHCGHSTFIQYSHNFWYITIPLLQSCIKWDLLRLVAQDSIHTYCSYWNIITNTSRPICAYICYHIVTHFYDCAILKLFVAIRSLSIISLGLFFSTFVDYFSFINLLPLNYWLHFDLKPSMHSLIFPDWNNMTS